MDGTEDRRAGAGRAGVGRALTLFLASGVALVGVLTLVGCWIVVGARAGEVTQTGSVCLTALDAQEPGAKVTFTLFPPRSECSWYSAPGTYESEVLAQVPPALGWAATAAAVGGIATCVGVLVWPRLRR